MVARRRFVFAEKMYRRLAAEAGVHSTAIRAPDAGYAGGMTIADIIRGVGCCRDFPSVP
jgi:hypothetical protein